MAAFPPTLGSVLNFGVCMALVGMPEPGRSLLLAAHQCDPLIAAAAKSLPNIRVAIHPPRLLGLLERTACCCADAMRETLVIPESRVLQHKPTTRLADPAPAFALISMATHPSGRVQVAFEPQLLFMRNKILVGRIHILRRRWDLFFVEGGIQIRGIRKICVVPVERMWISIALEHAEQAMGEQRRRLVVMVHIWMEAVRRELRGQQHAVTLKRRCVAEKIWMLLRRLQVAKVQGELPLRNSRRRMA